MINLHQAEIIYSNPSKLNIINHTIKHDLFCEFSFQLEQFIKSLGEEFEKEDWKKFTKRLKRFRFEQHAAPLGFNNLAAISKNEYDSLQEILNHQEIISPDLTRAGRHLLELLLKLMNDNSNPLMEKLIEILENAPELFVVILENRLIKPTEKVISNFGLRNKLIVLSEYQLRGGNCFDEIVCLGASRWYSEFIFTAPRASLIHLLRYEWIRDKLKTTSHFIQSVKSKAGGDSTQEINIPKIERSVANFFLNPEDIAPSIDLVNVGELIAKKYKEQSGSELDAYEVEARLFWLEGRRGVFLEETTQSLIIDLDEESRVRKLPVSEITPGIFILLREGRGGDLIIPIANNFLGKKAQKFREFQKNWKRNIRQQVKQKGMPEVINQLKDLGSVIANEVNLRNWMSEDSIETRNPKDFSALIRLSGIDENLDICFSITKQIAQAHKKAGRYLRKLLLEQVAEADLTELEKHGKMRFELTSGGGRFIATRVVQVSRSKVNIAVNLLNKRFNLERER